MTFCGTGPVAGFSSSHRLFVGDRDDEVELGGLATPGGVAVEEDRDRVVARLVELAEVFAPADRGGEQGLVSRTAAGDVDVEVGRLVVRAQADLEELAVAGVQLVDHRLAAGDLVADDGAELLPRSNFTTSVRVSSAEAGRIAARARRGRGRKGGGSCDWLE